MIQNICSLLLTRATHIHLLRLATYYTMRCKAAVLCYAGKRHRVRQELNILYQCLLTARHTLTGTGLQSWHWLAVLALVYNMKTSLQCWHPLVMPALQTHAEEQSARTLARALLHLLEYRYSPVHS